MDNAQKAIMIGVGLFITIIIISLVMLITSTGQDMANDSMEKLSSISNQLSASEWNDLDGKSMNGSQVLAYAKKYYKSNDILCYYEATDKTTINRTSILKADNEPTNSTTTPEAVGEISDEDPTIDSMGEMTDTSEVTTYIAPTARYKANLIKTAAGDPVGVFFDLQ